MGFAAMLVCRWHHVVFYLNTTRRAWKSDIYLARSDSNNVFSEVERLPFPINTPGNDQRPHFHPDGKTLYFSTNGLPGMGGSDLYKTQLMQMVLGQSR